MGQAAGETNPAAEVRGNGFGFKHLWLETTLPSLTSHGTLKISQDMNFFCFSIVDFVC